MQPPRVIDTQAHLDGYGPDLDGVLCRARQAGVDRIVAVGAGSESADLALALARRCGFQGSETQPGLAMTAGLHPHDARHAARELPLLREVLVAATAAGIPAAVGEIGLDYYRDLSPRAEQRAAFWAQIEWAHELKLPVVVHDRDAHDDVLAVLRGSAPLPRGGVLHCFSGDTDFAESCIELGMHISFAGPITYPSARNLRELASRLPLARLLVETDCPYLTPVPHRGKRNEPAYVAYTAQTVAAARREPEEEVYRALWNNSAGVFWPAQPC
jgi:TatD DNase family protein